MGITLNPIGSFAPASLMTAPPKSSPTIQRRNGCSSSTARQDHRCLGITDPAAPPAAFQFDPENQLRAPATNSVAVREKRRSSRSPYRPIRDRPWPRAVLRHGWRSQNSVDVGALPDMLTFTPDGAKILVANEGEPDGDIDPDGSVSIINLSSGVLSATCRPPTSRLSTAARTNSRPRVSASFPDKNVPPTWSPNTSPCRRTVDRLRGPAGGQLVRRRRHRQRPPSRAFAAGRQGPSTGPAAGSENHHLTDMLPDLGTTRGRADPPARRSVRAVVRRNDR